MSSGIDNRYGHRDQGARKSAGHETGQPGTVKVRSGGLVGGIVANLSRPPARRPPRHHPMRRRGMIPAHRIMLTDQAPPLMAPAHPYTARVQSTAAAGVGGPLQWMQSAIWTTNKSTVWPYWIREGFYRLEQHLGNISTNLWHTHSVFGVK